MFGTYSFSLVRFGFVIRVGQQVGSILPQLTRPFSHIILLSGLLSQIAGFLRIDP